MFYIVDRSDHVVGRVADKDQGLPEGFRIVELDSNEDLLGSKLVDGKPAVKPVPEETSLEAPMNPKKFERFIGSDLFKQARIKAHQHPVMAVELTVALIAEQIGDRKLLAGSLKAIRDLLRQGEPKP